MENTTNTRVESMNMDINDALFRYFNASKIAKKYRESKEGIILEGLMTEIKYIAKELLLHHDITCCSEQKDKHFEFQCRFHEECVIASYHTGDYAHLGMEQVEEFVTFLAYVKLQAFIDENRTCPTANRFEREITFILEYCKMNFSRNIYVVDYNEKLRGKLGRERTNVLQVEEDKDLSLGMPVQPQEIENDEQPENEEK
jgi:hypothetical protein